jgi:hypothetical protein
LKSAGLTVFAAALACAGIFPLGCGKKPPGPSASSSPSAAVPFTSYEGTWKAYVTKTAQTAECKAPTDGTMLGPKSFIVTSTGAFAGWTDEDSGVISKSGKVTGTFTDGPICGTGPWTGTCVGYASCSGTYVTYGISQDRVVQGESGTWIMTR